MSTPLPEPALRPNPVKKWIRSTFLSPYLRRIPRDQKTLDLACGWGFSFSINPDFFGVELDDECVRFCQRLGYKVQKANLLGPLPFPDGFFDNCFSHDVLEHFEAPELDMIFGNVHRVLRVGGMFMNVIPNRRGYEYGVRLGIGHKHFATTDEVRQVAERTGFEFVQAYSAPVPNMMNPWFTHAKYVTICRKRQRR